MEQIKIIHKPTEEKPFLVIYKPKKLPSAPLSENDSENALSYCLKQFPELKNVQGRKKIEYGLLHRIDTPTDGLLLIAANQECYDFLLNEQKEGRFIKFYNAICDKTPDNKDPLEGFPKTVIQLKEKFSITSFFRPYGIHNKEVRPVDESSGKAALKKIGTSKKYFTEVKIIEENDKKAHVECKIAEGYRHQVRCHLAWAGLPIIGDVLYNWNKKNCPEKDSLDLQFSATKIEFEYPKGDLNSYEITFTWT